MGLFSNQRLTVRQNRSKFRRLFNTIRSTTLIEGSKRTDVPCQPEIDHWILALPDREIDWKQARIFMELSPPIKSLRQGTLESSRR